MSNLHDSTSLAPEPDDKKVLISAMGWIGAMMLFAIIVLIAYVPMRSKAPGANHDATRFEIKEGVDNEQRKLVGSYGWVNQAEGVVRIPVERAMELVVREQAAQGGSTD